MELGKNAMLVILLVAFVAIGAYVFVNSDKSQQQVIASQGSAEITSDADFVLVYANIETSNISAQDAKDANAVISDEVITELVKMGFERKDIETENFNIYQEYSWEGGVQKSKGWKATNSLKVKITNLDRTGKVVDSVVNNGGLVQYISFELTKEHENELKAQALEQASEDARIKAEALAKGSGKKLGSLVSINSNDYQYYPYRYYEASGATTDVASVKSAATNIQPKSLTVTANVQATYRMK